MYCRLEQVRTLHKQFNKWLELDFVLKLQNVSHILFLNFDTNLGSSSRPLEITKQAMGWTALP